MTYINQSMSVRAYEAYLNDEKPISKWKKEDILQALEESNSYALIELETFKNYSVKALRNTFLRISSWHHTGKYYNATDFYSIYTSYTYDEALTELETFKLRNNEKSKTEKKLVKVIYEENVSRFRNYPSFKKFESVGILEGAWIKLENGKKKKKDGVHILEIVEL